MLKQRDTHPRTASASERWHTYIVTELLMSACGDLALNGAGHLTTKRTYDLVSLKELPAGQFQHGETLARIGRCGWTLTAAGAEFILDNCPPEADRRHDISRLERIAKGEG
jgi:hypothetical protein